MINSTSVVGAGNINETFSAKNSSQTVSFNASPVFDWNRVGRVQTSLAGSVDKFTKKCAVNEEGVFRANMKNGMSFGAKIKQLFENIKLKFSNPSSDISKDCKNLTNLLKEASGDTIFNGKSHTRDADNLLKDIESFQKSVANIPNRNSEPLKQLKESAKEFLELSKHANVVNNFSVFYDNFFDHPDAKEPNTPFGKEWEKQQIEKLNEAMEFAWGYDESNTIMMQFKEKLLAMQRKVIGDDKIREFYEKFNGKEGIAPEELAQKCNAFVAELKSLEIWLKSLDENVKHAGSCRNLLGMRISKYTNEGRYKEFSESSEKILRKLKQLTLPDGCRIDMYRGIPYIADQDGNPHWLNNGS